MLVIAIFVLGYLAIVFEHSLKLNKSATALVTGVLCWTAHILTSGSDHHTIVEHLAEQLGQTSQILFFLLGAMTIVELIDAHDGFTIVTSRITSERRRVLLVLISLFSFFLSAVLDNLTTSIVMMSLVRKLLREREDRMLFGGVVIISANAGGAWSPIGDVTTTMLWLGNQITALAVIKTLILPSLVSVIVPVLVLGLRMKGSIRGAKDAASTSADAATTEPSANTTTIASEKIAGVVGATIFTLPAGAEAVGKTLAELNMRVRTGATVLTITHQGDDLDSPALPGIAFQAEDRLAITGPSSESIAQAIELLLTGQAPARTTPREQRLVFAVGVGVLLFVPVFKTVTHLPPVMGILLGLGVFWIVTEIIHKRRNDESRSAFSVASALQRVDTPSVLFFLGILLAIGALESNGSLHALASWMSAKIGNVTLITLAIGLASAVVDNVPLVAAAQGMYPLSTFPTDDHFWRFLAYCAGTGGSILIIGSAAGVAVMGMERITFGWYVRRLSLPALLGYAAGALAYLGLSSL